MLTAPGVLITSLFSLMENIATSATPQLRAWRRPLAAAVTLPLSILLGLIAIRLPL